MERGARTYKVSSGIKKKSCITRTTECINLLSSPSGPLLGYPLLGVSSLIQSVEMEAGTSPAMVSACVSRCMMKVMLVSC